MTGGEPVCLIFSLEIADKKRYYYLSVGDKELCGQPKEYTRWVILNCNDFFDEVKIDI